MADEAEVDMQAFGERLVAEKDAEKKRRSPRHAPAIPRVNATAVARAVKNPSAELRDLDTAFRARFFALFDKPEVMARIERLLLSKDDKIVIDTLKTVLASVPMQRREGDAGGSAKPITLQFNMPRPEKVIDVTP